MNATAVAATAAIAPPRPRGAPAAWLLVGGGALLMLAPFYCMLVLATHPRAEIMRLPPPLWFGAGLADNLALLAARLPFWRIAANSLYVALMHTALSLLFCAMAGHAFALYRFRGQRLLYALVMATLLLPPFMAMIPNFVLMNWLGWLDQPRALYLPGAAGAFGIALLRRYIAAAVPPQLVEAARLDGCGEWRLFWQVVLPQARPALALLALVSFIGSWNNLIGPLVVLQSAERYTLPLALRTLQSPVDTEWGALMAACAVAVLPLLLLFALCARRLVDGLGAAAGHD